MAKLNPAGSGLTYATFLGGNAGVCTMVRAGIARHGRAGSAYVAGPTFSSDFPDTTGAFDTEATTAAATASWPSWLWAKLRRRHDANLAANADADPDSHPHPDGHTPRPLGGLACG